MKEMVEEKKSAIMMKSEGEKDLNQERLMVMKKLKIIWQSQRENQEAFVRKDEISVRMKTLGRNFF